MFYLQLRVVRAFSIASDRIARRQGGGYPPHTTLATGPTHGSTWTGDQHAQPWRPPSPRGNDHLNHLQNTQHVSVIDPLSAPRPPQKAIDVNHAYIGQRPPANSSFMTQVDT